MIDAIMARMGKMSFEELTEQARKAGGDAASSVDTVPPYILAPMFGSYFGGAHALHQVYKAGGWQAVNALYAKPPSSTEQLLHADVKLATNRDEPQKIVLPKGLLKKTWKPLSKLNTAGELGMQIYFRLWGVANGEVAAAGWDGDTWQSYAQGDKLCSVWSSIWDSPEDAAEFTSAAKAALAKRNVPGVVESKNSQCAIAPQ